MSTHDTAESLREDMESAFCAKWTSDLKREARSVLERAIARLALLERGIERADSRGTVHYHEDTYPSLLALIEELGMELHNGNRSATVRDE